MLFLMQEVWTKYRNKKPTEEPENPKFYTKVESKSYVNMAILQNLHSPTDQDTTL